MRTSKPLTITLGRQHALVEQKLASGEYESASEVVRAGLRALEREDRLRDEIWRHKIAESLADPRPDIDADSVFEAIEALHKQRTRQGK